MKRTLQTLAAMALTGLVFSSLTASASRAQEPGDGGLEIVELTGNLEMILGNQIKMKSQGGQETVVLVGDETTFNYQGTAEPTALSPGLMVRFTAAFDALGTPQAPLTELEIFRPARARRMTLEMRQSQTPGIYPVTEKERDEAPRAKGTAKPQTAERAASAKPASNNPRDRASSKNAPQANRTAPGSNVAGGVQDYLVVGMLRAIQGDKLQIVAGSRPIIVQADPNLEITVSAGDPMFCQPGDEIKLTGLKNPAGLIQGDAIEVTGAKPLGSVDEKAQARNGRNVKRGKLDDPDSDAAKAPTKDRAKPN